MENEKVQVDNITSAYTEGAAIFEDFSWQVEREEAQAVIGPSGCGKTTLLSLLAGLRLPNRGKSW